MPDVPPTPELLFTMPDKKANNFKRKHKHKIKSRTTPQNVQTTKVFGKLADILYTTESDL